MKLFGHIEVLKRHTDTFGIKLAWELLVLEKELTSDTHRWGFPLDFIKCKKSATLLVTLWIGTFARVHFHPLRIRWLKNLHMEKTNEEFHDIRSNKKRIHILFNLANMLDAMRQQIKDSRFHILADSDLIKNISKAITYVASHISVSISWDIYENVISDDPYLGYNCKYSGKGCEFGCYIVISRVMKYFDRFYNLLPSSNDILQGYSKCQNFTDDRALSESIIGPFAHLMASFKFVLTKVLIRYLRTYVYIIRNWWITKSEYMNITDKIRVMRKYVSLCGISSDRADFFMKRLVEVAYSRIIPNVQ